MVFGVVAICFGLLTLLTVENTFEHGIVYFFLGVLGGSILPSEDVSYLKVCEGNGKIIFEQIDIDNEVVDENSIKA